MVVVTGDVMATISPGSTRPRRGWPLSGGQTVAVVLVIAATVFIAQNTDDATVEVLNIDVTAPLWIVLAVLFLGGVLTGMMLQRRRRRP
jgi:uncharacterized integral membrane protein